MVRADRVVDVFRAAFVGAEVVGSALPAGQRTPDAAGWLRQELAGASVVVALVTPASVTAQEVAFQLGAGWALGKRLVLLLDPTGKADAFVLALSQGEPVVLDAGPLIALLVRLGNELDVPAGLGSSTVDALERLFGPDATRQALREQVPAAPAASALADSESEEEGDTIPPEARAAAEPPPSGPRREGLPGCTQSLAAGRAFSDAVFHRISEPNPAAQLDAPFGTFLDALGGNWGALRPLGDCEVWIEVADNVLEGLGEGEAYVRAWYEVGYQLATLLNVVGALPESQGDERQELVTLWNEAWGELQEWLAEVGFDRATVSALGQMLDNVRGPEAERDYTLMAQVQQIVRGRAEQADTSRR